MPTQYAATPDAVQRAVPVMSGRRRWRGRDVEPNGGELGAADGRCLAPLQTLDLGGDGGDGAVTLGRLRLGA